MTNQNIFTAFLVASVLLFNSCKKELPVAYSGNSYLEFYSPYDDIAAVTVGYSSFYYLDASKITDTVWLRVKTVGSIPTKTSVVKFEAFKDNSAAPAYPDAVAGIHYVPFDDAGIQKLMKVDAGKYEAYIPVVFKRDASLKDKVYQLRFKIVMSEDFSPGSIKHIEGIVYISDRLSQPSNWTPTFFLGSYGTVKHQFMIEESGQRWDNAFISTLINPVDVNRQSFYLFQFTQALKTLNEKRKAAGLTELRENPSDPATAVTFPNL